RIPLAITRSYRSGDTNAGVFGLGTMMGYEEYLRVTSAAVLTYVYHGDARTDFVRQPDGTFTNSTVPAFRGTTITRNADDTRTMRDKHGRTVRFTSASFGVAVPTAMVDANGNQISMTHDGLGFLTGLVDTAGRQVTV